MNYGATLFHAFDPVYNPARSSADALLLEDDSDDALQFTQMALKSKQLEFNFHRCRRLQDAEGLLKTGRVDIIFADLWIGCENSIPFIQSTATTTRIPFVIVTALDGPDIRRIAFRAGAVGFLSKNDLSTQAIDAISLAVLYSHGMARGEAGGCAFD